MNPIPIIRNALERAAAEGIGIEGGACFNWVHGTWPDQRVDGRPRAVNWMGAVLWTHRQDPPDFSFQRLKRLLGLSDFFWFYRFSYGFNQGRALSVLDPETMREIEKDDVSLQASRLAKEFCAPRAGRA